MTVKALFFYVENRLVDSTDLGWIQSEFGTLTGIFDWLGLHKYFRNTMGVVCKPCLAARVRAGEDYTW